jgi:outer membrane protein assembly factor BamB
VLLIAASIVSALGAASCRITDGTAPGASGGLTRRWNVTLADSDNWPGFPAVVAGRVVMGARGGMVAFDTASGALGWHATIFSSASARAFGANIAVHGNVVCLADTPGIGCVDALSGRVLWHAASDSATDQGASAADETSVYYGTRQHRLIALSLANGATRWSADLAPNAPFPTRVFGAVVRNDTVYATTVRWLNENGLIVAGDLVAVNAQTGQVLWTYTPAVGDTSGFQTPAVLAGNLAILSDVYYHGLRAIDLTTHREVWRSAKNVSGYIDSETAPLVSGDTIFAGSTDTQLYALDLETGRQIWRSAPIGGSINSVGLCAKQIVAVPMGGGDPVIVDRSTHVVTRARLLESGDLLKSAPIVFGSTVYAKGERAVYAFSCS